MRLDPRILIPAALTVGAIALPAAGNATDPITGNCPPGYVPMTALAQPSKDSNNDTVICMKTNPAGPVYKDDNCCPNQWISANPDDYVDNL
jgi:hypothetical protein